MTDIYTIVIEQTPAILIELQEEPALIIEMPASQGLTGAKGDKGDTGDPASVPYGLIFAGY